MSSTTTVTETRTAKTVLDDYALRHTGSSSNDVVSINSSASSSSAASAAGDNNTTAAAPPVPWDTTHRRVPPYRPLNYARDLSEVRVYQNGIEQTFIGTMFTGLFINATTAHVARMAFGDKFRNAPVGGEM
ncbi:hypothetical protein Micbo1qcDRAFT_56069 [Microdochium bolleyi]|uniref:Uncharacterized protein n=1 Tax=Microdochium bolleyi TaxID=196109 RepID=A0A136IK79_9PEZI|nr:hypothetical protein Micbo1qcDRAFT_56069 [Microdochium bolleyi]